MSRHGLSLIFTAEAGRLPHTVTTHSQTRPAAARGFVRSLNILLKFARMYDFGHPRTVKQYDTAWNELRTALGSGTDDQAGLLLAVSGEQLLLDGTPLESAASEKSFARMLSAAGIASIHFSPKMTQASLGRLARGFPTGTGAKPTQLAEQLKAALQGDPHIHVNEVCFVPADSAVAKSTIAAQLTARTLGLDSEQANELFSDPERLLQLIVAAEGTKSSGDGSGGPGPRGIDELGSGAVGLGNGPGDGGSGGRFGYGSAGPGGHGTGGYSDGDAGSAGSGSGSGLGSGSGFGDGRGGSGAADAGGNGSPALGNYSGDPSLLQANAASLLGSMTPVSESGAGAEHAPTGDGSGSSGTGSGTWNIVGGSGGGRKLDPNAGGFWLKKDGNESTNGSGVVGAGAGSPGAWNIVGSEGEGSPLEPNAGGFWLNKDLANPSGDKGSPKISGSVAGISGSAPGGGFLGGTGRGPNVNLEAAGTSDGWGVEGAHRPAIGRGGAPGQDGRAGGSGTGAATRGGSGTRKWRAGSTGGNEGDGATAGRWTNATAGIRGSRGARGATGSMAVETGLMTLHEDELQGILQVLAQIARTTDSAKDKLDPNAFQSRLSTLPRRARFTVSQALSALAAQSPTESADKPTLLKLAEHIAIRFALESYERGDIEVNSVRNLLNEMSGELDGLRKILGVYEERMKRAGLDVQSHTDMLAQQFWAQVPDEKKKAVLESPEAWCVPPAKVREYVEGLLSRGEKDAAESVLGTYASCITAQSPESRGHAAMGLAELAGLYAKCSERLLISTIRQTGVQLAEEHDSELQSLVGAAFVRLTQEATTKRAYPAIQRAVELIDYVESERPGVGKTMRPRIAVEDRLPEFIDETLRNGTLPIGLSELLRRMPGPASAQLAMRFSRAGFRDDCELLISMMQALGAEGLDHLRKQLRHGEPNDAIDAIGLLTRMDLDTVENVLPARMKEWKRTAHDRVVRQIAGSGASERGRLLLSLFDQLDRLIRPLAVDEIGLSGEQLADMRLVRLAEGDLPKDGTDYLRLKAIEALGRLRTAGAESVLRKISEGRKAWRWASPSELRLVAAQAMAKIDSEWLRSFVPRSGLSVAELSIEPLDADPNSPAIRQRRYPRLRLERPVSAETTNLKDNCSLEIPEMALGGGVALCVQSLHPGSVVSLRISTDQKPVKAQTIVRGANTQARAFEVVEMELEERAKLRRLLVQLGNLQKQSSPQERNRRGTRTIISTQSTQS